MACYTKIHSTSAMTTDALFREFGKFISDSLESLGWALQTDSGDIDWATVTRETTTAWNMKGYEIRKSGTGGGTAVYLKIQYGAGFNANSLGIKVAYGTGSDGAGTLTGKLTADDIRVMSAAGAVTEVAYTVVAGDDERFTLAHYPITTPQDGGMTFFQRTCDVADGADNSTGWIMGGLGYKDVVYAYSHYGEFTAGPGTADTAYSSLYVPRVSSAGGAVPYFPVFVQCLTNSGYFMLRDMLWAPYAYAPMNSIHVVNHYGANRTYRCVYGNTTNSGCWGYTTVQSWACLMRVD